MKNLFISLILLIACVGSINGQWCYYCADCPVPFWRDPTRVTEQYSNTGYCVKKSYDAFNGAKASRGPADPGLCQYSGRRIYIEPGTGRNVYADCCTRSYCNTGSLTSKSTIVVLLGSLALLFVNRYV